MIEEREVHPIGDVRVIPVDIRIIAVTLSKKDLAKRLYHGKATLSAHC